MSSPPTRSFISRFLAGSDYRPVFREPRINRAHDWLRLVAFLNFAIVGTVMTRPEWLMPAAAAAGIGLVAAPAWRLVTRAEWRVNLAHLVDFLTAGLVGGLIAQNISMVVAGMMGISVIGYALHDTPLRLNLTMAALGLGVAGAMWILVGQVPGRAGIPDLVGIPLIGLYTAALTLGAFIYQAARISVLERLDRETLKLSDALEVAPVMVALLDHRGRVTERTGRPDVVGRVTEGSDLRDIVGDRMADRLLSGDEHGFTTTVDGRSYQGRISAMNHENGVGYSLAMVDITELEATRRRLQALIASKNEFIGSISHELRTPLTAVVGFTSALYDGYDVMESDEAKALLRVVVEQGTDLSFIIDDLLVAARVESDTITVQSNPVSLDSEVRTILRSVKDAGVELYLEPVTVTGDAHRLRQVIRNLVTNAHRYGGSRVQIVTARGDDGRVTLIVQDSGSPIPPEMASTMFEPYGRSRRDGGLTASVGLGLTVSRKLIELMGGTLEYRHTGEWSQFLVTLPETDDHEDSKITG